METWLLALAYGIHLVATVVSLGALLSAFDLTRILFLPQQPVPSWIRRYRAFLRLTWMAVALLWATGMFQMTKHPLYQGTLNFSTPWAKGLLFKHILVLAWIVGLAYLQWVRLPAWERWALRLQAGQPAPEGDQEALRRSLIRSLRWQQVLVLAVLVVTAWLRAQR